jgi:ABC-2 type transport system ATP-binding protein
MSIEVVGVSRFYGGFKALDAVSFSIKKGEVVGFLGPNGAGKSTLMKILTGFLSPSEGWVKIKDIDGQKQRLEAQRNIGYLPEHNPLYKGLYVKEYLELVAGIHSVSKEKINPTLQKVGLEQQGHKKIRQLSKGYQQRVGIAAAMLHDPEVLILDEPTTGLDPNQLVEIRSLIRGIGKEKTVLFSSHVLQEVAEVCNRVLLLNKGKLVADEKLEILEKGQPQVLEVSFDFQIEKRFFKEIKGLKMAENLNDCSWELTFHTQEDHRASVFDFALEKGLKILKLSSKNRTLEDLFRELTQ